MSHTRIERQCRFKAKWGYVYILCTQTLQLQPGTQCTISGHCHPHWQYGNREGRPRRLHHGYCYTRWMQDFMGRTWARPIHSMKVHYTLHTMSTVWISDSSYNTGTDWLKQMWCIIGVTHTAHWPSTPHTQQERWLHVYIDHWQHSQMSCTEYTSYCYVATIVL